MQIVYFSRLIQVYVGSLMLPACRYLVQVSLFLIGREVLGNFFRYRPMLSIGRRIVQILLQHRQRQLLFVPVLRIRIRIRIRFHRIHVFLGLLDPDPDSLVTGMDPDPSIIMQKY
jgi:hypothetical protein